MSLERRKAYVETALGLIHIDSAGVGPPVLLLHQTPRSVDEYRDVVPLLARDFHAIAMDTPGFGASRMRSSRTPSIELWAQTALSLLDALKIDVAAIVGHHTGAAIALEIAAAAPERVDALVLSACPFVDADRRKAHASHRVIDDVEIDPDGAYLGELWRRRQPFYPPGDTDLLSRFVADALRCGPMAAEGHRVVNKYRMEERIGLVRAPTLVIAPGQDPHALPAAPRVAAAIRNSILLEATGAMVPFPDQAPELFAHMVRDFLSRIPNRSPGRPA
ncbi:MAG: alpha/beta fold hydrolase [Hyphomicrobiales bacterium]|nr:alpha/beta fold hydrolase [Hyphomicrobiales bacterium]